MNTREDVSPLENKQAYCDQNLFLGEFLILKNLRIMSNIIYDSINKPQTLSIIMMGVAK